MSATGTVTVTPVARRSRRRMVGAVATVLALGGVGTAAWLFGPWRHAGPTNVSAALAPDSSQPAATPPAPAMDSTRAGDDTAASPPVTVAPPRAVTRSPAMRASATTPPANTPATRTPPADTLVPGMRRRALEVRQQAVAAGASAADLAAGDALAEEARSLADDGRVTEAVTRLGEALASWSGAATAARARAAAPPTPPPVTPAPVDPRPAIQDAIAQYARALEARNLDAVRRIYPSIPPARARNWRDFFDSVKDLEVRLNPSTIQLIDAGSASANVAATMQFTGPDGRAQRQDDQFVIVLGRAPSGSWLITEIR